MKKYKRGLLFGTFSPIHEAHISLIRRAKDICDKVYLVMDSDAYIRKFKAREPFTTLKERKLNLEMLGEVAGTESDRQNKKYWINKIKPDVLIKGDDWKGKGWNGENLGVKVVYLKHIKGIHSSTWHGNTSKQNHSTSDIRKSQNIFRKIKQFWI